MIKYKYNYIGFRYRNKLQVFESFNNLDDNWKNIDVLINNADAAHSKEQLLNDNIKDWETMIDGNVKGLLYVSKAIINNMTKEYNKHQSLLYLAFKRKHV